MKIRTQVQFEEEQYQALKRLARDSGSSLSEVLRQIVARHLEPQADSQRWEAAWGLVGLGADKDGATDVSENHDHYLHG